MKILNFIVTDQPIKRGRNEYTVLGECFIQCETPIPVITKNRGCVGLGIVKEFTVSKHSTTIKFNLEKDISQDSKKAYYDLYRTSISVNEDSNDPYENTDTIIPGAIAGSGGRVQSHLSNRDRDIEGESISSVAREFGFLD